jgi:hypothetical protein
VDDGPLPRWGYGPAGLQHFKGPGAGESAGPELALPTGDTIFVLDEFYESPAGVVEHWRLAVETWQDLSTFMEWSGKAKRLSTLHSGTLVQALW